MPELKIGLDLASLDRPLKPALRMAAALGLRGVVLDARNQLRPVELTGTGLRQFRKQLDDLDLVVPAIAFPTRRGYDDLEDLDRRVDATKAAMKMAYDLGARVVFNQVGDVPEDEDSPRWTTMVEVLQDLGRHGQHCGALFAITTATDDGPRLARLLDAVPGGLVGVDLDPGRLILNGHSPGEAAEALSARVLHVTASDAVRDLAVGRPLATQLGRGSADFPNLLGALDQHDYRGWFTLRRGTSADPGQELTQAASYLRSL